MKKSLLTVVMMAFLGKAVWAQHSDFIPGTRIIFEDNFSLDAPGDLPAKWSSSGSGEVVTLDDVDGRWLKIAMPTAVSPELKKPLPENCTIEFDLYLKSTSGVAPLVMFGLTSLSDVAGGQVFRNHISVKLYGYNKTSGSVIYAKNIQKLGEIKYALQGYVNRVLRVSIAVNKTRWRVYLDGAKVVDLPKLLTPEFRNNFFVASAVISPAPEEGVYISNVRIAESDVDARSLLIKQLMEHGSVTTDQIQYSEDNEITTETQVVADQIGQILQENPDMQIQINSIEEVPTSSSSQVLTVNEDVLKQKADILKSYIINKFKLKADQIITDARVKTVQMTEKNKAASKAKQFLTEIIKIQ